LRQYGTAVRLIRTGSMTESRDQWVSPDYSGQVGL
jgi:hypothetical protein